ncbi:hypothetical protein Tsp_04719 [Trichinella spiralis]|uniref:hypothetical protein n=1 Tax=Trichinella spiralis TaxID=6334 RepID=UPI0001EFD9EE|nr:hypothetical protein Tsp_04719 [Trichinella spiralis]
MLLTSSILRFLSGKYHISVRFLYKKRFFRGIYLTDGMIARKGDVLVRMFNMDYFPGMNVSYKQEMHDKVLRAMCDGTVLISTENVEADFQYFGIENTYKWRHEVPLHKLTFNVYLIIDFCIHYVYAEKQRRVEQYMDECMGSSL